MYSLLYLFTNTKIIGVISPAVDVVVFVDSLFFLILIISIVIAIILLLPSCDLNTKEPLISKTWEVSIETELIFQYSPFKDKQRPMEQFNKTESKSGTFVSV